MRPPRPLLRTIPAVLALAVLSTGVAHAAPAPGTVRIEAETLPATLSRGDSSKVRTSADSGVTYSAGKAHRLLANAKGDYVSYTVNVPAAGTYRINRRALKAVAAGVHQLTIDGVNQGVPFDSWAPSNALVDVYLGQKTFTKAGPAKFTFTAVGKRASSGSYNTTTDYFELVRVTSTTPTAPATTAPREVKVEGERLTVATSVGDKHERWTHTGLSGGMAGRFTGNRVGDYVSYDVSVAQAGTYRLRVGTRSFSTRGIFQASINGVAVGRPVDTYASTGAQSERDLGTVTISRAGVAKVRFTATGKNARSSGYGFCTDYIRLVPAV